LSFPPVILLPAYGLGNAVHGLTDQRGNKNTQFVIFRHFDHPHPHIHIVYNRVDNDDEKNENNNENENKKTMTKEEKMYREERQLRAIVECNLLTTDCVTTGTLREFCKREGF
jgi:hypothetical protein